MGKIALVALGITALLAASLYFYSSTTTNQPSDFTLEASKKSKKSQKNKMVNGVIPLTLDKEE
jgi:hypothetical protein